MKKFNYLHVSMGIGLLVIMAGCNKSADKNLVKSDQSKTVTEEMMSENGTNPDEASITAFPGTAVSSEVNTADGQNGNKAHCLYTESNSSQWNSILIYKINNDGTLQANGSTASGGAGTGMGLGSQGAVVLDKDHQWLFAVNAGSNSVSSFKVNSDGSLTLAHTEQTWGKTPVSVTVHDNLLYVLNKGTDNIHGFWIGAGGRLTHITGSTQPLSGTAVDAPQIGFTPNGNWIIVTEKATNIVGSFQINTNGTANPGIFTASVGATPFGFDFSRNRFMIVSNAAGGAAGAGSATSYTMGASGMPAAVNGAVPNHQAAPCWFAVTKYGRFAFTTNTASNTVSTYFVNPWGALYLVKEVAARTDNGPVDIVIAANNYFVYELNGKASTIGEYHRKVWGGLEFIGTQWGLPAPATGLATY
ncbi:MAG: lactonase family protein [Bacteroidota bacterium]|nr:lactonase family protein [Bacteroidota bacterium]